MSGAGLVRFINNAELDKMNQAAMPGANPDRNPNDDLITGLESHIERCWAAAKEAKTEIEQQMIEDLYRRMGQYTPQKRAQLESEGMPIIFMNLTATKCRAAEGWVQDIAMPAAERPFSIEPSPVPEVPEEVKVQLREYVLLQFQELVMSGGVTSPNEIADAQRMMEDKLVQRVKDEAKRRAEKMEDRIDDICVEGDWYKAVEDSISHLITSHNCFVKGPVIQRRKRIKYVYGAQQGQFLTTVENSLMPVFYSPSPFDIYPSPKAKDVQDGYLLERVPMTGGALFDCIGLPGFDEQRLRAALEEYRNGYQIQTSVDTQLRDISRVHTHDGMSPDREFDVLEFHGNVQGRLLKEWGYKGECDPHRDYAIEAWKVGRFIVRVLINDHPLGRRPYASGCFDRRPGFFWGFGGVPRTMADLQDICNAAARSIVFNMGISSGPQVSVNVDRLAVGETISELKPWRIWQTKDSRNADNHKAVDFFQPDPVVAMLQSVFDYFSNKADEYTGIPSYATGIPSSRGAAGTASGMSMLMGQATRQMKRVALGVDRIVEDTIGAIHFHLMLHDPDQTIKGDAWVRPRGTSSLMIREQQQVRLNEFLMATTNPIDTQIMGPEGRAELLRKMVENFDIPVDRIVPNREEILAKAKAAMLAQVEAAAAAQGPATGGPPQQGAALQPDGSPQGGGDARTV